MSNFVRCDMCASEEAAGYFPPNEWLTFHTKPESQGKRYEHHVCPKCKKIVPPSLALMLTSAKGCGDE